jgi:hypothetical protein
MALDLTLLPVAGPLKPLPETRPRRTRKSGRKRPADKSEPAAKAVPDPQPKPKGGGLVDDLM